MVVGRSGMFITSKTLPMSAAEPASGGYLWIYLTD